MLPSSADGPQAYQFGDSGARAVSWAAATGPLPESGFLWLNLAEPGPAVLAGLETHLGLHPLATEDALHAHQRAKVESYPTFEFVVVHGVRAQLHGPLQIHELNLFVSERYLISVQHGGGLPVQELLSRWERVPQEWRGDSSSLLYVLLDALVDEYSPFTDGLEQELSQVRHHLVEDGSGNDEQLRRIFALSELAHGAHAVVFPLKEVLSTLLHAGPPVVSPQEVAYFRDIRDHAVHTAERLEQARNQADRAFDIYHALENRRQGDSARQLTQVATIFLPTTLVTGFFGQNFSFLIEHVISGPVAFWTLGIGFELAVLLLTLLLVRRVGRRSRARSGRRGR